MFNLLVDVPTTKIQFNAISLLNLSHSLDQNDFLIWTKNDKFRRKIVIVSIVVKTHCRLKG